MKNLIKNNNHKFITAKNSFTLIELLIAVSIILIFSGFSLAFYNKFTEEKKLENEAKKLVDVLELAKKKTSAGDVGNYSCDNFFGYHVVIRLKYYGLRLCCSSGCDTNNSYLIQWYNLPSNMSILSGDTTIQFKPLTTMFNQNTITLRNSSLSRCRNVSISPTGITEIGNEYYCGSGIPSFTHPPPSTPTPTSGPGMPFKPI